MATLFAAGELAATDSFTATPGSAEGPRVIGLADGRFLLAWSTDSGLEGWLFDRNGSKIGDSFTIADGGDPRQVALLALPTGGFVASWAAHFSTGPDGSHHSTWARVYGPGGQPEGEAFLVNTSTFASQQQPTIALLAGGGFLIAWTDQYGDSADSTHGQGIRGQIFNAAGARVGGEFPVNTDPLLNQYDTRAITLAGGDVLISWATSHDGIHAQFFDSAGAKKGSEFRLATGLQTSVALPSGGFLIVEGSSGELTGQIHAADGSRIGSAFPINTKTAGDQFTAQAAVLPSGEFMVSWYDSGSGSAHTGVGDIKAQLFDAAGNRIGEEFTVNTGTEGGQWLPQIAAFGSGDLALFWIDYNAPYPVPGLQGRLLYSAVSGTAGADFLPGTSDRDFFYGLGGNDVLFAEGEDDELSGGEGDDYLQGGDGDDTLHGGEGNDEIGGQAGNDLIRGEAGADKLIGGTGADDIDGGDGADTIRGDHSVSGVGDGDDLLAGGAGNDLIGGGGGDDSISGGADFDQLHGGAGADLVDGGDGDDFISGFGEEGYGVDQHSDILLGGPGNDRITAGYGDSVDGGDGTDIVYLGLLGGSAGVTADLRQLENGGSITIGGATISGIEQVGSFALTDFDDVVIAGSWGAYISGFGGNDDLTGSGRNESIYGGDGDDVIRGGGGHDPTITPSGDRLNGEAGNDTLYLGSDAGIASGGWGDDVVHGGDGGDGLYGDDGNDRVYGGGGRDGLHGGPGNDLLDAGAGDDIIYGGSGDDEARGGSGDDIYYDIDSPGDVVIENEGEGTDQVRTSLGTYSLLGTGVENLVAATSNAHDFRGNELDNIIESSHGNDLLRLNDGGEDIVHAFFGNDVIYFGTALSAGDRVYGGPGRDSIVLQGNVTAVLSETNLYEIESISIQSGANAFFGDTANNLYDYNVTTGNGNVVAGQQLIVNAQSLRAGEDFAFDGSAESDGRFLIYGGHGVDILKGGAGADVFFFEGQRWSPTDKVDGGAGRDSMVISAGDGLNRIEFGADSLANIESISLNNLYASDPSQRPSYDLVLHNGNVAAGGTLIVNGNSIPAGGQVVNIDGRAVEDGNLILFAGGGHDVLIGGDGADLLFGGSGQDSVSGGLGADTFRYDSVSDSPAGAWDLIGDFQTGLDKIDLARIDANSTVEGNQAFSWIGSNAFSGSAGELRAYFDNGYQRIEGDTDDDGVADLLILLQIGTGPIAQGDFLF